MDIKLLEDKRFYVYVYLDPRCKGNFVYGKYKFDYEPFYVGFGHGKRSKRQIALAKNDKTNNRRFNKINKIIKDSKIPEIIKICKYLNKEDAKKIEIFLISKIGRKDLNKGPLLNFTDGGDGTNRINIVVSEKTKQKMRNWHKEIGFSEEARKRIGLAHKGKNISKETRNKLSKALNGRKVSKEHAKKNSLAFKGKKHTEEAKEKIGKANSGKRPKYIGEKISKTLKEKYKNNEIIISDESRYKMGSGWRNKKRSELSKKKMSESQKGIKKTKEHREKLSKAHKGKKLSNYHKENISNVLKGHKNWCKEKTEEQKEKLKKRYIIFNGLKNVKLIGRLEVNNWCKENEVSCRGLFKTMKTKEKLNNKYFLMVKS